MKEYIDRNMAISALRKMRIFHDNVSDLYSAFGIHLLENTGRRNMLLSHTQERFFADEISLVFPEAESDGRTGCADIVIPELDRELECKLTSGSGKYSSFDLQTDWETLSKKGELDYLYVLASKNFDEFAVLFFSSLTTDDFFPPAPGSRGRARMNKAKGMKKCSVLVGSAEIKNELRIAKLLSEVESTDRKKRERLRVLEERLVNTNRNAKKKREKILSIKMRENQRFEKKIKKIKETIKYWESTSPAYSFKFERIDI
tara:strand:+ start:1675 stop:2451 length:777 start_codon:yes stop_codon:yes gene_type:complete